MSSDDVVEWLVFACPFENGMFSMPHCRTVGYKVWSGLVEIKLVR